ncbi:immunoglobulin-like domain-containing protein [Conexibacter sp. CPCC 206217]|uniref:immunoglobulin-like domain-containing protein n=1 Tax=Conexibacter sp. CPCC 206217 TaxID=3064574 RepID=UPI00271F8E68|nr:immunoglobulin-like domain-containing protein [Conexibacter sp. CPCC 206217]MDO8213257.1 hypothetical protein [Conexibacter sp. CPCC 206217]
MHLVKIARIVTAALLGAALLGAAALPAAAGAASGGRPARAKGPGVRLTWPLRGSRVTVLPGAVVTVRVRARWRGSARVTIALTRARDRRVLKRRTRRAGRFSAKLPAATGVSYVLSARADRRLLRRTTLVVPAPRRAQPSDEPSAKQPPPASPPLACSWSTPSQGPFSGTFTGDKTVIDYGETLTVTFTNTSPQACLTGGVGYRVERRGGDGTWVLARLSVPFPAIPAHLPPGSSASVSFTADDRWLETRDGSFPLLPGRYRITQQWSGRQGEVVAGTYEFGLRARADSRCGQPSRAAAARLAGGTSVMDLVRIANEGGVCVRPPGEIEIERVFGDGSAAPVATVQPSPCASPIVMPGTSLGYGFQHGWAPLLEAGRYRAVTSADAVPLGGPDQALPLTVEFELDEAIGGEPLPIVDCAMPDWEG